MKPQPKQLKIIRDILAGRLPGERIEKMREYLAEQEKRPDLHVPSEDTHPYKENRGRL